MLFDHRHVGYSQSGEEGILARIMEILGIQSGLCCEFGAWDGKHLSNTRRLMERGWRGLMIEADKARFQDLLATYPPGHKVISVCAYVDDGDNSLAKITARVGVNERFDLVSIDIDGMDFEVFSALDQFEQPPLVVIVEVHTCHSANDTKPIPGEVAEHGVGQPFGRFIETGKQMGYRVVSFIGTNAIFVHKDAGREQDIPTLAGEAAAKQNLKLIQKDKFAREFLYLANIGKVDPRYEFNNPLFSRRSLGVGFWRARKLRNNGISSM